MCALMVVRFSKTPTTRCYGLEIAPAYVDTIIRRWLIFTTQEPLIGVAIDCRWRLCSNTASASSGTPKMIA